MPEIIYNADQGAGVRKIIRIMQGDSRSHIIRFVVPRYDSGVDLAHLVWYIKLVDVEGTPDIALPSAMYEVTDSEIRVRWTVNGISTDAVGSVKFQLYGVYEDEEGHVISWTSGAGEIEITQNIGFTVTEEQEAGMTALDELIVFVQGSLNGVIAAGDNAAAAATSANAAATSANAAATSANAAAERANAAAERAEDVERLSEEIDDLSSGILPLRLVENEYINATTGAFQSYNGWKRTKLIPVSKYYSITFRSSVASGYNAFYKADGSYRSTIAVTQEETTLVIPDDAYYVAFSNSAAGMEGLHVTFMTDVEASVLSCVKGIGAPLSNPDAFVTPYDDCNTLPNNTVVTVTQVPTGLMTNLPRGFTGGTILTFNSNRSGTIETAQIAINKNGILASRHLFGADWSEWQYAFDETSFTSVAMFPTLGVVGDSYASGAVLIDSSSIWGMYPDYSWPSIMGRMYGINVSGYSSNGLSTRTWLENTDVGLTKLLSDSPSSLYMLCLGTNDGAIYNEDSSYLGSIADINDDHAQNPDTFYGNYGKIIDQLRAHAPNAKIVMVVPFAYNTSSATWNAFKNAVIKIAGHYGIPYINSMDDAFFNSDFFQSKGVATSHPVAMTYAGAAVAYNRLMSLCIQENFDYFMDVH